MGKTLVQQLIEQKTGFEVNHGDVVEVPIDLAWGSEMTIKWALERLKESNLPTKKFSAQVKKHAKKIQFVFDHLVPPSNRETASILSDLREFANEHGIEFFDIGYNGGIQHRIFEERGYLSPGKIGIGADSHSCTYGAIGSVATGIGSTDLAYAMITGKSWMKVPESIRIDLQGKPKKFVTGKDIILKILGELGENGARYCALEFTGDGLTHLDMATRFTMSNMSIESGAKFGLFPTDSITMAYLKEIATGEFAEQVRFAADSIVPQQGDEDGSYKKTLTISLEKIEPMIAMPYSPVNALGFHQLDCLLKHPVTLRHCKPLARKISHLSNRINDRGEIPIHQVFIGSCSNGRIEDLRIVAKLLEGKRVSKDVRVMIIPASQQIYRQAEQEGLIRIFLEAGCYIESSSCGPCIGSKSGVPGKEETAIFTTSRNFYGRKDSSDSIVFLAGPAVAAASALKGKLTSPGQMEEYYSSESELTTSIKKLFSRENSSRKNNQKRSRENVSPISSSERRRTGELYRAWQFGDDITAEQIMPVRFCQITEPEKYKEYIMRDTRNSIFLQWHVKNRFNLKHDIIAAGKNFGCGSSVESAPLGIKESGIPCVIAHSFARIFYRNALNIGLPLLEIGDAVYRIDQGDNITIDFEANMVFNITKGEKYHSTKPTSFQLKLIQAGGLFPYMESRL